MMITLQQNLWYGGEPCQLELPDDWDVEVLEMPCDIEPVLTRQQIVDKINSPYGMMPLSEMAKGKKKVGIAIDDISRGTPTKVLAPIVLDILVEAGIKKEQIIFICATGSHAAHNRKQFADKLGEEIVGSYRIYNHNCYENCTNIGKAKEGFDVLVNSEFMSCDLKIGFGGLLPHGMSGFSGGYRMLIPGLCHLDTIEQIHRQVYSYDTAGKLSGNAKHDAMHRMISDIGKMAGDFYKIDCIYNTKQEVVDVFAGDAWEEYCAGAKRAEVLYGVKKPEPANLIIANANAKPSYATMGLFLGMGLIHEDGGDMVLVNFSKEGQSIHYLRGDFGEFAPSRIPSGPKPDKRPYGKTIYFSPYADYNAISNLHVQPDSFVWADSWPKVLSHIQARKGPIRAIVMTDASMMHLD